VLASCQGRRLHALFGLAPPPAANAGKCRDLMHGKDETKEGDLPDPPPGGVVTSEWLLAQAAELRPLLDWLLQPAAPAWPACCRFSGVRRSRCRQGSCRRPARSLIRTGVELSRDRAGDVRGARRRQDQGRVHRRHARALDLVEGGRAVRAYLLITSAVRPVADYYWQNSLSPDDAPALSKSVYRRLLASPALDYSPLILNVGLGATFVGGSGWGSNGLHRADGARQVRHRDSTADRAEVAVRDGGVRGRLPGRARADRSPRRARRSATGWRG
jgi:hypothetical protein